MQEDQSNVLKAFLSDEEYIILKPLNYCVTYECLATVFQLWCERKKFKGFPLTKDFIWIQFRIRFSNFIFGGLQVNVQCFPCIKLDDNVPGNQKIQYLNKPNMDDDRLRDWNDELESSLEIQATEILKWLNSIVECTLQCAVCF